MRGEERCEVRGFGVTGRFNHVERNPVRQKITRGWGFREATELSFGRAGKYGLCRVSPWLERSLVKSYLFRNFPPSCLDKELISKFHEVGTVVDLYRPKKRDVQGKNFGFVRLKLENEAEGEAMLGRLNSLWMGSYKLQVFIPRFDRNTAKEVSQKQVVTTMPNPEVNQKQVVSTTSKPALGRFVVGDRSFASIVKGNASSQMNSCNYNQRVTFIPTEEDKEWLVNAKVGLLKKEFSWEDCGDDIQKEVQGQVVVKGLGEDLILIQDQGDGEEDKEGLKKWEQHWFRWVRDWKPEDVCQRRVVWTNWFGVPLHAWSERFFRQISLRVGSFLDWDTKTKNRINLEVARVKIWGYAAKRINDSITVSIEGRDFIIRICEESAFLGEDGDEFSSSCSSESDDIQGGAMWEEEDSGAEEVGAGGRGIGTNLPKDDFFESEKENGDVVCKERRLGIGSVSCNFENGCLAAGRAACGSCGDTGKKEICQMNEVNGGLEVRKDEQIKRGPIDWPNSIREGPTHTKVLAKIDEDKEKNHFEEDTQDVSLPFPPGWGPDPAFRKISLDICESENPMLSKGSPFNQGKEETEESIPYPPGWGPESETRWLKDGLALSEGVEGSARQEVEAEVVTESERGINSLGSCRQDSKMIDEMGDPKAMPNSQNPTQTEANLVLNCSLSGEGKRQSSLGGSEARGGRKLRAESHKKKSAKRKGSGLNGFSFDLSLATFNRRELRRRERCGKRTVSGKNSSMPKRRRRRW